MFSAWAGLESSLVTSSALRGLALAILYFLGLPLALALCQVTAREVLTSEAR